MLRSSRSSGPLKLSASPDIVELRVARGGPALPVMRVVMSGMASRHDMPLEELDDVQLAVETLMAEEPGVGDDLVLCVWVESGCFAFRLEGLTNPGLKAALLASDPFQPCEGCLLDVRLFLDSLVDSYAVVEGSLGWFAVEMKKRTG